ncbi:MAG: rRNA maturation RNase YbeY [Oscillospiraceae bacterium]|nr:rRNA maturation RNase YbeY [Oscillospiraceae bacterium]
MHKIQVYREKRNLGFAGVDKLLRRAAKAALKAEGVDEDCIISIMLTDDAGIHEINLEQRGIDRPTDVLSFPMNELVPGEFDSEYCEYDFETDMIMLGDMVISLERCEAQAGEYGHSFEREISYLCVHSVLHLLGYDHLDEGEQKARMRLREDAIMDIIGL